MAAAGDTGIVSGSRDQTARLWVQVCLPCGGLLKARGDCEGLRWRWRWTNNQRRLPVVGAACLPTPFSDPHTWARDRATHILRSPPIAPHPAPCLPATRHTSSLPFKSGPHSQTDTPSSRAASRTPHRVPPPSTARPASPGTPDISCLSPFWRQRPNFRKVCLGVIRLLLLLVGSHCHTCPSGRILTGSLDNTAAVWDPRATAVPLARLVGFRHWRQNHCCCEWSHQTPIHFHKSGHENAVCCVTTSASGNEILTASWDGLAGTWVVYIPIIHCLDSHLHTTPSHLYCCPQHRARLGPDGRLPACAQGS